MLDRSQYSYEGVSMKKLNRFGVLLGLLAGTSVISYVPAALAQDAEPGPASDMMENVDVSMQGGPQLPPPLPGMMPDVFKRAAMMMCEPDEMMAMRQGEDLMFIRAGVHGNFSDDQLEKMYKIKSDFMNRAETKMVELKLQERVLHDLLTQPDFETGKAQSIQNKVNGLRDELANLKLDQHVGLLNCLTADQRKELRRNFVKHMDFGMMGMQPGMQGMSGMHCGEHYYGGHGGSGGQLWDGHKGDKNERHEHHEHHEGSQSNSNDKG